MFSPTKPFWNDTQESEPGFDQVCLGINIHGAICTFQRCEGWGDSGYVRLSLSRGTVTMKAMAKPPVCWAYAGDLGLVPKVSVPKRFN